jgi:nitrate/nitrite transporter NarK
MKRSSITKEIFVGMTGEISSKRVMMFLSFCMMIIMAIFSTIYGMKVEQFIFDGFLYIVVGGLFSVASEKFSNAFKKVDGDGSERINN